MASHDPEIRSAVARVAGYARAAQTPYSEQVERMAHARAVLWQRLLDEVDPHQELDPADRERRATARRREHLARAALASLKARRARKAATASALTAADRAELDVLAAIQRSSDAA